MTDITGAQAIGLAMLMVGMALALFGVGLLLPRQRALMPLAATDAGSEGERPGPHPAPLSEAPSPVYGFTPLSVEDALATAKRAIDQARGDWRRGANDKADLALAEAELQLAWARAAIPPDLTVEGRNLLGRK